MPPDIRRCPFPRRCLAIPRRHPLYALSLPAGYLFTAAMAEVIDNEIICRYTPTGALLWLGIITFLAVAASWFPACGATRISVWESLAYQ